MEDSSMKLSAEADMADVVDPMLEDEAPSQSPALQVDHRYFDLEGYISSYVGRTKIARLTFIAEHCKELANEAVQICFAELKKGQDTTMYKSTMERFGKLGVELPPYDQDWVDNTERAALRKLEQLEVDLNVHRTNLIKESTRMGLNDLADFYHARGDLNSALKSYNKTKYYCTTPRHQLCMFLNIIQVSVDLGHFNNINSFTSKAEQFLDSSDKVLSSKIKCLSGLANLKMGAFKLAARKFLETHIEVEDNFAQVMSTQDVGLYGGLCALAAFDRSELKRLVIDNQQFKEFLELVPTVREIISDFYNSNYTSCLNHLERLRLISAFSQLDLLLDIYLHDHVDKLFRRIRQKALIQYFSPYVSVDMRRMASAFNTTLQDLEKEVAVLILDDLIQARIDSHSKILYARHTDQKTTTFDAALRTGDDFLREARSSLLRLNLMRSDCMVRPAKATNIEMK